jgi:hypothetical protein
MEKKRPENKASISPQSLLQIYLILGKIRGQQMPLTAFGWFEYTKTASYQQELAKITQLKKTKKI